MNSANTTRHFELIYSVEELQGFGWTVSSYQSIHQTHACWILSIISMAVNQLGQNMADIVALNNESHTETPFPLLISSRLSTCWGGVCNVHSSV